MLKNLIEGQKKVSRVTKIYVLWQLGWICFRCRQANRAFLVEGVRKGSLHTNRGSGFVHCFYGDSLIQ
jgi:hypothetical protein